MRKFLLLAMLLPVMSSAQGLEVVVEGAFDNDLEDTKAVYIFDPFLNHNQVTPTVFPVIDGKFSGILKSDVVRQYYICTMDEWNRSSMKMRPFYPDADTVRITINNDMDYPDYKVSGGAVNDAMNTYMAEYNRLFGSHYTTLQDAMESMYESGNHLSASGKEIEEQMNAATDRETWVPLYDKKIELEKQRLFYSPEMQKLQDEYSAIQAEETQWELEWMAAHTDLHSYSMLIEQLQRKYFFPQTSAIYAALAAANPSHPYEVKAENMLAGQGIEQGALFVDFTLPDINNTEHTLSKEIAHRVSVIHFWASWCGTCRVHGRHLVPLYEKYSSNGFTVVGVAREYKNTGALAKALQDENYSWLNLVELDDSTGLWAKYGILAAGCFVLIDENGTVVNSDATIAEIEKYLAEKFD